jgi:Ser/Thr protein kinase RdoA (MazF antagonist)
VPDPFPAQRSIVSAAALAARLLPRYDLPPPVRCELLQQGDNDTYLVRTGAPGLPDALARRILRVYRLGKHSRAAVEAEVALLDTLHASGVAVAPAVRQRDGAAVATLEAPEGPRHAVLFAFAPGDLAGFGMTLSQARRYGQEVARLHAAADVAPGRFDRRPLDLEALLDRPLAHLDVRLAHRPRDAATLRALAERLRGRLAALPRTGPQWGLCHGDLHKRNVVFAAGDAPTILDFDCAGAGWRAYDLAVFLWSTAMQGGLGTALWDRYLEGYLELRPLGPAERDAVPAFVAARDLWTMGGEAGHVEAGAAGCGPLSDSYWDRRLAALQAWCAAAGLGPEGPPPRTPGSGTAREGAGAAGPAAAPDGDGDAPHAEPEHHRLIRDGVLDAQRFVRAAFSGRRRGHPLAWERLVIRPVEVRGRARVQFTYHDARRSVDRNLAGRALRDELAAALRLPFRSVFVELTDRELHVTFNKRGEVAVRSVRKTEPVARTLAHDHQKRQPLPAGAPDPYLIATGVMAPDGRVRPDKYDKFRQVNEFLRLLDQLVTRPGGALPDTVVDLGCGNAYLTFAAYHHFRHRHGHPVALCGVDAQGPLLVAHREAAARLGWDALTFVESAIADYAPPRAPDLVLALHACDTATDDALARAIRWRSRYVLSVPCCQHALQQQLRTRDDATALRPVYRDGILAERLGDVLTDTLRALILRICGYATDVVQFVASEHTAKNLMLRAARTARPGDPAAVAEYVRLRDFLGVTPYLERLLGAELAAALAAAQTAGDPNARGIRCSPGRRPPAP